MKKHLNCLIVFLGVAWFLVSAVNYNAFAAGSPPVEGGTLPEVILQVPGDLNWKKYLGVSGESFTIPGIRARAVIIEIFSLYCPYCQREAPKVNELYRTIEEKKYLRGKIKLIGIGAGNSFFETKMFRKKYEVPFPLFADGDYSVHKRFGEVRTPYFIVVKIKDDGSHKVIYSKLGGIQDLDQFLGLIIKRSGLEAGGQNE